MREAQRKEEIQEQEFVTQLRMFATLTPSMEFIPDFKNFITIMQQGLTQVAHLQNSKSTKKRNARPAVTARG